jgi:Ca-activated chloride channel family protein
MTKLIQHIKAFIKKHKTLIIVLTVIKLLLKIGLVIFFIAKANNAKAQSANTLLREGNKLYAKEKYNNATESYSKALQKAPKDIRAIFNQGDALYRLNELDKAKELFNAVAKTSTNTDIQARAHYNIGNAWYKQEKWEESAKAYKQSLKLNPKDEDAKYNLMMALAKIKKNGGGGGKDNKEDNQDKKDQKQQQDKNQPQNGNQQQKQEQQGQDKQQQQQAQQQRQISNEEAQKLLEAIGAEEGKVQQKLSKDKNKPQKSKTQKDW